jgi:hypothetical protein
MLRSTSFLHHGVFHQMRNNKIREAFVATHFEGNRLFTNFRFRGEKVPKLARFS